MIGDESMTHNLISRFVELNFKPLDAERHREKAEGS